MKKHQLLASRTYCLGMCGFTDTKYNEDADKTIEYLSDVCDKLADKLPLYFKEVNADNNVLEIETTMGKYVINKQAPNKQLWLSSPISGPHHYSMPEFSLKRPWKHWHSGRDGHNLIEMLEMEFSKGSGSLISFDSEQ